MAINPTEQSFDRIAQLLIQENYLTNEDVAIYQQFSLTNPQNFSCYLIHEKLITAAALSQIISQHYNLPIIDLAKIDRSSIPIELLGEELIVRYRLLPLSTEEGYLLLATDEPSNQSALKEIQFYTGHPIKLVIVEADKLSLFIEKLVTRKDNLKLDTPEDDAPIIELVHRIINGAVQKMASDIHFEPYEHEYRIRYRQDGLLTEIVKPPLTLANRISTRIKILANLDISERRKPQDGRFHLKLGSNHGVDFRVSTCPTISGEKIAIRILDTHCKELNIESLGMSPLQNKRFYQYVAKPQGLILVTGPTGSGKSLTLYTALNHLNTKERNISTVEDPVEIKIAGINQVNINPKAGLNFSNILRSFLRQDPDVIMVGEIRDSETAELAIKAAQTGHLVFSTLHTNSAAETLNRLNNLGIETFNLANSLSLIIAQRLVRRLCELCKVVCKGLSHENLIQLGMPENDLQNLVVYKAQGCPECNNGYCGRIGLFELLPITKTLEQLILSGANSVQISEQARKEGMLSIYQSGLEKIKLGLTTFEDLKRVTMIYNNETN
ncbi:MAG: Flp pilus assembly complex ATPase component TadA [Tatlockia sp.]|nr:Flp pilus assembly complex ATPase component TadA [Tatlockia sp.]